MFWSYLGPSSGGTTVCIQQLVLLFFLDDCLLSWLDWIVVYIQLYLLMMGLDTPKTCRSWRNILRISCASSWFLFTRSCYFSIDVRRVKCNSYKQKNKTFLVTCQQNALQNWNIKVSKKSFKNVANWYQQQQIKIACMTKLQATWIVGIAAAMNLLSSCLLSRNINIQNCNFILFCLVMKVGLSHYKKKIDWGSVTVGYWGSKRIMGKVA